jgi:hypothetical protein
MPAHLVAVGVTVVLLVAHVLAVTRWRP